MTTAISPELYAQIIDAHGNSHFWLSAGFLVAVCVFGLTALGFRRSKNKELRECAWVALFFGIVCGAISLIFSQVYLFEKGEASKYPDKVVQAFLINGH